jgi:ribosome-binding factor A
VATLIQQILAQALTTRLKDPRIGFVTVTGVTVTHDLSVATVRVSIMGDEQERAEALAGLEHASGYLRSLVARAADLRATPELRFVVDRGLEHARRIDQILTDIHQDEPES